MQEVLMSTSIGDSVLQEATSVVTNSVGSVIPTALSGIVSGGATLVGGAVTGEIYEGISSVTNKVSSSVPAFIAAPINNAIYSLGGEAVDATLSAVYGALGFGTTSPFGVAGAAAQGLSPLFPAIITWTEKGGQVFGLLLTCSISEQYSVGSQVTSYPIDTGFSIADHTMRQHPSISIQGLATNAHFVDPSGAANAAMATVELMSYLQDPTAPASEFPPVFVNVGVYSEVTSTDKFLRRLVQNGTRVNVGTVKAMLDNCVITGYSYTDNVDQSNQLHYSLEIKQLTTLKILGTAVTPQSTAPAVTGNEDKAVEENAKVFGISSSPVPT